MINISPPAIGQTPLTANGLDLRIGDPAVAVFKLGASKASRFGVGTSDQFFEQQQRKETDEEHRADQRTVGLLVRLDQQFLGDKIE